MNIDRWRNSAVVIFCPFLHRHMPSTAHYASWLANKVHTSAINFYGYFDDAYLQAHLGALRLSHLLGETSQAVARVVVAGVAGSAGTYAPNFEGPQTFPLPLGLVSSAIHASHCPGGT